MRFLSLTWLKGTFTGPLIDFNGMMISCKQMNGPFIRFNELSSVSSHRSRRLLGLATGVTGVESQKQLGSWKTIASRCPTLAKRLPGYLMVVQDGGMMMRITVFQINPKKNS